MIKTFREDIPLYEFEILQNENQQFHFVTTRNGGISSKNYESLNLSFKVGDLLENVIENRQRLIEVCNLSRAKVYFPDQCHTSRVGLVVENMVDTDLLETDALITNKKNLCIAILAADCVPILFFDPKAQAIGVAHSGWKGTVGRIAARTIELMVKKFGTDPVNLRAGIGPSISQQNYEVGEEVAGQFRTWFSDTPEVFIENKVTGKVHIDLWEANRQLLLRCGVQPEHIEISGLCTYDNQDDFFSARRDGMQCGRFATGIMLK